MIHMRDFMANEVAIDELAQEDPQRARMHRRVQVCVLILLALAALLCVGKSVGVF